MEEKDKKVGVYICYCGGNISDHVDVEEVRSRAEKMPGVSVARTNMFMCSDPGQEMIIQDVKANKIDRVVVASCAPSLHETTFRGAIERAGANPFIYEHANIREQVSWVHHGDPATDKATVLVASAAAKAERLKPLDPIHVDARKHAVVIGGGIAGIKTALGIAQKGIKTAIIEKTDTLGGQLNHLDRLAPFGEKASDILSELLEQVLANPSITVHTGSQVKEVAGYVGNFDLSVMKAQKILKIETGAIVMATGAKSYRPREGEFGYDRYPEVIPLKELIQLIKGQNPGDTQLKFNGRPVRNIAMIHCVGSRQIPGIHEPKENGFLNEYCSRTCCTAMLNASVQIRENFPRTRIFEMYRDIRTYGRGQEELYNRASANKVVFMRYEADAMPEVEKSSNPDFPLSVKIRDSLTFNEEMEVPADLVVLATGLEPNDVSDLASAMKLPVGTDRFLLEVHPKLRPVEFPVSGIFLAGTCQAPMDSGETCNAAGAAAVKTLALLEKGYIELDPFVAEVDPDKCKGHGACVDACIKEGALALVEVMEEGKKVKKARVTPAMCMGCGACAAVCPEKAIDVNGWALQQYESMVDAIVADGHAA
ncbi:CoB--CoM heterodisulfide reductase iron-sulfur subunit A family protein [Desulfospira joergensenii]|uniref:CoB--CoM heterodisulfide reductase iron-sulfur subunit A family protein n=1 Tax=Desulfospira joergensenii TaxID=53329 RepID=UPI0003B43620|nr:CoB--CoM heterodisulfide reductase iron-sulfur subunit A family protein [Desulfospira joergensenii]